MLFFKGLKESGENWIRDLFQSFPGSIITSETALKKTTQKLLVLKGLKETEENWVRDLFQFFFFFFSTRHNYFRDHNTKKYLKLAGGFLILRGSAENFAI